MSLDCDENIIPAYRPSNEYLLTREKFVREYMNASSNYAKWVVFESVLRWLDAKEELEYYMKAKKEA